MTAFSDYPLFVPSEQLTRKTRQNWNAKEATEYREWLFGVVDGRVEELTRILDEPSGATPSEHLMALGEKVVVLLEDAPFSEEVATGRRLTNLGYALAADMGLLVARYLIVDLPERVRWDTIRRPKSELAYNLPVLEGFRCNYLEPVGGSIAEASAILRGGRGADAWKKMYEFWVGNA